MKHLLLFLILSLTLHSCQGQAALKRWYSKENQGFQIIDSSMSYMNNLKATKNGVHLRADRAQPNAFSSIVEGALPEGFYLYTSSLLSQDTFPFVSFDVYTKGDVDYFVGPTFGSVDDENVPIGLPLQVSTTGKESSAILTSLKNVFLYSVVVDQIRSNENTIYFYATGWRYTQTNNPGLIVLRGNADISGTKPVISEISETDIQLIDGECYDVWNELNHPEMYLSKDGTSLIVGVMGRCDQIFKFTLPEVTNQFQDLTYVSYDPPFNASLAINAVTYSPEFNRLVFTMKIYNTPDVLFSFIDMSKDVLTPAPIVNVLANEATPVMAIDEIDGSLITVLGGANILTRYVWRNGAYDFVHPNFGVLPSKLRLASDILIFKEFVYVTTWEADAQVGRMPNSNFCPEFCSGNGLCRSGVCMCADGFEQNPNNEQPECLPSRVVESIDQLRFNSGAATAFGVLFVFTLLCGGAGWFIWWRKTSEAPIRRV